MALAVSRAKLSPGFCETRPSEDPWIGRTLNGAYAVDRRIGVGAMALVYAGRQLAVGGRPVAIKILKPEVASRPYFGPRIIKRFQREALATSRLDHPNAVRLYDAGQSDDGALFLVLERLDGITLADEIARCGGLPAQRIARIGGQICGCLRAAHGLGIIHRDLKPGNVFLCRGEGGADAVKVMDFGLARLLDGKEPGEDSVVTVAGEFLGSPAYMSPEQIRGAPVGPEADLYALGAVIHQMWTGTQIFEGSAYEVLAKHATDAPPPLEDPELDPVCLAAWNDLVSRLLAKDPSARIASAAEVERRLAELGGHDLPPADRTVVEAPSFPIVPARPVARPAPESVEPIIRRPMTGAQRLLLSTGAILLCVVTLLAVWRAIPDSAEPPSASGGWLADGRALAAGPALRGRDLREMVAAAVEQPPEPPPEPAAAPVTPGIVAGTVLSATAVAAPDPPPAARSRAARPVSRQGTPRRAAVRRKSKLPFPELEIGDD